MKNRTTFKEGDQVFDILHGWGKVTYLYSSDWEKSELDHLVCRVKFDNGKRMSLYKICGFEITVIYRIWI